MVAIGDKIAEVGKLKPRSMRQRVVTSSHMKREARGPRGQYGNRTSMSGGLLPMLAPLHCPIMASVVSTSLSHNAGV